MSKPWKPGSFPLKKYVHYVVVTAKSGKRVPIHFGKPHPNKARVEERAIEYTRVTKQAARVEMV